MLEFKVFDKYHLVHTGIDNIKSSTTYFLKTNNFMDEKKEDISEKSKNNHIRYYKSLNKIINDIQKEKNQEEDPTIKNHLKERIDAMKKDMQRIRNMFPNVKIEEWDDNSN